MIFFGKEKGRKGLKEKADAHFTKGKWADALVAYEKVLAKGATDVKMVRRVADLRVKLGRTEEAVKAYRTVADHYAKNGFLVKAIAIYKILLRIDPEAEDVAQKLSELYAERGLGGVAKTREAVQNIVAGAQAPVEAAEDTQCVEIEEEAPQEEAGMVIEQTAFGAEEDPAAVDEVASEVDLAGAFEEVDEGALPTFPLFSDLPRDAFVEVLNKLVHHELAEGDYIFRQGDPGDSIFIIASGAVEVAVDAKVLATLEEGSFFGEGAFLSSEPRNADVRVSRDSELLEMRREDLEKLMARFDGVGRAIDEFYRRRIVDRMMATGELFDGVDPAIREEIEELFENVNVAHDEVLVEQGDKGSAFYVIKSGQFSVTMTPPGKSEPMELATIGPGQFFGEIGLLTGEVRTATVTALDEGEVLKVEGEVLMPYLEKYPGIRDAICRVRNGRVEQTIVKVLGR